ncbi:hypothetical protein Tco_0732241, partial [Tanacetum coccineum]
TLKQILPFMEERRSSPSLSKLQHFRVVRDLPMTLEEAKLQMHEAKRSEEELAEIEAKQVQHMNKMKYEYNHCINFRDDPLPIMKFNYKLVRIQMLIKVDTEYAQEVYNSMIYEIESRPDFVQAREIIEKNLDSLGMD